MNNKLEELKAAVKEFSEKHNVEYETVEYRKEELWDNPDSDTEHNNWAMFEKHPGVYVFSTENSIVYVGKSIDGVGGRIYTHLTNKEKLQQIDEESLVTVFMLNNFKHFTGAIESYLIEMFKPLLNKRIN